VLETHAVPYQAQDQVTVCRKDKVPKKTSYKQIERLSQFPSYYKLQARMKFH